MSVRNAAAGNIQMLAARVRGEAEEFDSIGERGIGDRMKRTAAEIDLAVQLLRTFDGPPAYDMLVGTEIKAATAFPDGITITPQVEELADWERELLGLNEKSFKAGDRVRIVNDDGMSGHPVGTVGVIEEDDGSELPYRVYAKDTRGWNPYFWHTANALELEPEAEPEELEPVSGAKIVVNAKGRSMMGEEKFRRLPSVLTLTRVGDTGHFFRTEERYYDGIEVLLARHEFEVVAVR